MRDFPKIQIQFICVGGRHHSAIANALGDITSKGRKLLFGQWSKCNGKKSVTTGDNTKAIKVSSEFLRNLGRKGVQVSGERSKRI